jgi:urate oxidase
MAYLADSTYGKDNVKFLKVKKDKYNPQKQEVLEATVCVLLKGNFDVSYTKADNSPIIPTDTVKNTILVEARKSDVWPIERFAAHLAEHFVKKYSHVSGVDVHIIQHKWTKYEVNGKLHDHSFKHDGEDVKITDLSYSRNGDFKLSSSLKDLTVLKSTGSGFIDYNVCDYTTLKPTTDRILSTDIDCTWTFDPKKIGSIKNIYRLADQGVFDDSAAKVLKITLDRFALENSPSVQATMYNMCSDILDVCPYVLTVSYALPNKHYILFDLSWKGLDNDNVLFYPSAHPNGLIKCTVGRDVKAKL